MKTRWPAMSDANGSEAGTMRRVETCPDCGERLPRNSPVGLCPQCLLRLGASFALDPSASRSHKEEAAPFSTLMARVHLREPSDDAPLIRPTSVEGHGRPDSSTRYQL